MANYIDPVRNFAKCVVSTGYNASATSIVLSAGEGSKLPDPATEGAFNLVWWNFTDYPDPSSDTNKEIVRVTARSADTLTVVRGQEGTTGATHNTSGKQYIMALVPTKKFRDDIEAKLFGLTNVLFRAYLTADFNVTSISTWVKLGGASSWTVDYDIGSHYSTANNRLTVTKSGYYRCSLRIYVPASTVDAADRWFAGFWKNGSSSIISNLTPAINARISILATDVVYLVANDYIEPYVQEEVSASETVDGGTSPYTHMIVESVYSGA